MTSRSTPLIVPTFGDPSSNHPYTIYFDSVSIEKKNVNDFKGEGGGAKEVLEESKSKKATNAILKNLSKPYSKTPPYGSEEKGFHDNQIKHLKAKESVEKKSINDNSNEHFNEKHNNSTKRSKSSQYGGRLGNPLSSQNPHQRSVGSTMQPNMKHGSTRSLPYEHHADNMKFGVWEDNPKVPITIIFDNYTRRKEGRLSLHSPALSADGGWQGMPSHKKISNNIYKDPSWWSRLSPKKWWKRLFG